MCDRAIQQAFLTSGNAIDTLETDETGKAGGLCVLLDGMYNGAGAVENSMKLKTRNRKLPCDPAIPLLELSFHKELKAKYLNNYLHTHVHSSFVNSSQKAKATQVSTEE